MTPKEPDYFGRLHPELRQLILQEVAESSSEGREANFWQVLNIVSKRYQLHDALDYIPILSAQLIYEHLEWHLESHSDKFFPLACITAFSEEHNSAIHSFKSANEIS